MTQSICMNCRFWKADDVTCHRYPPSVSTLYKPRVSEWPNSQARDGCGEFRPQVGGGPGLDTFGIKPEDYTPSDHAKVPT